MSVKLSNLRMSIPTYLPFPPNAMPFFLEKKAYQGATGKVYPIPFTDRLSNEVVDKEYDAYILENDYISVTLLPELGGKVHGAKDKYNNYEFVYQNTVIKPAMVGLAGPWVSGGIEFNWPQHHRPTTFCPMEVTTQKNTDGSVTVWMGEAEPFHRMRGMVGITMYPDKSYVEAKAIIHNRTSTPLPFMWWNNLAVRVHKDYKAIFPPDVAYGNDHDRRAVISFPNMNGVYNTARPFDYGDGTDARWFSNIKLPTSIMIARGQSNMDFLGGYDYAADAGTVTVSSHYTSVGKKMWTWGDGPFGKAWCDNLADNGDRYIELMTGVYTDNQPDFTYIMPGETKSFSQIWYPIHSIGEINNASAEGALALHIEGENVSFGAYVTSKQIGAVLKLTCKDNILLKNEVDISPESPVQGNCQLPVGVRETDVCLTLIDASGKMLISYRPVDISMKKAPEARLVAPDPRDVQTIEELYLHGAHLEQYKHHSYVPEDYFIEALKRDSTDFRCNLAMGRLMIEKADFVSARTYLEKSVKKITLRNDNPIDTEVFYFLACLERLEGNVDKAYDLFASAAWQYTWRSPCFYEMAAIDLIRGETDKAKEHLILCLETNSRHFAARALLAYIDKDTKSLEDTIRIAPQDGLSRFLLSCLTESHLDSYLLGRSEDITDIALDLAHAGLYKEATEALRACTNPSQMLYYHLSHLTGEPVKHVALVYCFPNRLEDIPALIKDEWQAQYLLGCLYYDRMNYYAAVAAWEKADAINPRDAFVKRCMAQALFDHFGQSDRALLLLEEAFTLAPNNSRILYELLQMKKNMGRSFKERLNLLEAHAELVRERDDCYLDQIILYTQAEQYEKAQELLLSKRFNIYEGGEGKLTRHHGWLFTLLAHNALETADIALALEYLEKGLTYPMNYGEGRHYSAQEGNIYYYTGLCYERMGDQEKAQKAFQTAVDQPSQMTEMLFFTALAHRKLGREDMASSVFMRMLEEGKRRQASSHRWGYFGVGLAAPLPSELDIKRMNLIDAHMLMLLGKAGLSKDFQDDEEVLRLYDPYNVKLDFFRKLKLI